VLEYWSTGVLEYWSNGKINIRGKNIGDRRKENSEERE
jgi:hypothetical protein